MQTPCLALHRNQLQPFLAENDSSDQGFSLRNLKPEMLKRDLSNVD